MHVMLHHSFLCVAVSLEEGHVSESVYYLGWDVRAAGEEITIWTAVCQAPCLTKAMTSLWAHLTPSNKFMTLQGHCITAKWRLYLTAL